MTRLGDGASGGVTEQALEVLRAVVVEVDLKAADLGNVLFLAPAGVCPDGVDAEIDVVALRRSGGAARPGSFPATVSAGVKRCCNVGRPNLRPEGWPEWPRGRCRSNMLLRKRMAVWSRIKSPWGRFWQYAFQHSLRGEAPLLPEPFGPGHELERDRLP